LTHELRRRIEEVKEELARQDSLILKAETERESVLQACYMRIERHNEIHLKAN
jgi:hypothetical protein